MSSASIRSALSTYLGQVTELEDVQTGRVSSFSGFPAARVYLQGIQNTELDTAENYRFYVYSVDIVMSVQIDGVTKAASEGEFQDAVDAVLDELGTEWTLGGAVEALTVEASQVRYEEGPQGVMVYLPITVYAKTLVAI